ncbi:G2/mitotic-specific cyclin 2 [Nematocida minor]|uniref:G2/mitotic-specific cyclin 2 n=1 Tax=Nematocida minor TaxID=1912983 RepID=UPI00221F0B4D|nr:G2/mitotic-specific cyclin 2 [Nematocida minor]KAI5189409.1 G2/mitotic-specific cyclin 2 [Nematocida minor]
MKVTDENKTASIRHKKSKRKAFAELKNRKRSTNLEILENELFSDIRSVSEYAQEILQHYKKEEINYMPSHNYMAFQEEIRWAMRSVLIDWIIDVHHKLNLLPETLYLSVNLIDRFLSLRIVTIGKLQLVGVAGLLVASKFQEIASPSVETFVVLTDRSFTENEILRAEKYMLHCLDYKINYPSPLNWLRQCSHNKEIDRLGSIILDSLLPDEKFLKYSPSVMGCAVAYLARGLLPREDKEFEVFHKFAAHPLSSLTNCIDEIKTYLQKPILHSSIFKKHGTLFTKYLDNLNKV